MDRTGIFLEESHTRREASTGGDRPEPWCASPPGRGSVWPYSRCDGTSGQRRGQREPRLRTPYSEKVVAGTLNFTQKEIGP